LVPVGPNIKGKYAQECQIGPAPWSLRAIGPRPLIRRGPSLQTLCIGTRRSFESKLEGLLAFDIDADFLRLVG
jgi:hypothetical protein